MLIYARVPVGTSSSTSSQMEVDSPVARTVSCSDMNTPINLTPPVRALEVVRSLNEEYDKNCAEFTKRWVHIRYPTHVLKSPTTTDSEKQRLNFSRSVE